MTIIYVLVAIGVVNGQVVQEDVVIHVTEQRCMRSLERAKAINAALGENLTYACVSRNVR